MVTAIVPANSFAVESSKKVVDSGFCGVDDGENAKWTYYDNHELVISGKGEMNSYYFDDNVQIKQPWYAYLDDILYVTIENGITQIGSFAFSRTTKTPLRKIVIPKSVKYIGNNFVSLHHYGGYERYICYEGSKEQWSEIKQPIFKPSISYVTTESAPGQTISVKEVTLYQSAIGNTVSNFSWEIAYNGDIPKPFINISFNIPYYSQKDNCYIVSEDTKSITDYMFNFYFAEYTDAKLIWTVNGKKIYETNDGVNYSNPAISMPKKGTITVKVDMVDENEKVIDSTQTVITSAAITSDDSFGLKIDKIQRFFTLGAIMPTVVSATAIFYIFVFIIGTIASPLIYISDLASKIFN